MGVRGELEWRIIMVLFFSLDLENYNKVYKEGSVSGRKGSEED